MLINITNESNRLNIGKIDTKKINDKYIVILCGKENESLKDFFIKNKCFVINISQELNYFYQDKYKKQIFDLIIYISELLNLNVPISLVINDDSNINSIINLYSKHIDNIILFSNIEQNKIITQLPLLKICNEQPREFLYSTLHFTQTNVNECFCAILSWIHELYVDNKKLKFPQLVRINSEELSCKMVDLTENNEEPIKIKII